jgi:hypothetical protein
MLAIKIGQICIDDGNVSSSVMREIEAKEKGKNRNSKKCGEFVSRKMEETIRGEKEHAQEERSIFDGFGWGGSGEDLEREGR